MQILGKRPTPGLEFPTAELGVEVERMRGWRRFGDGFRLEKKN